MLRVAFGMTRRTQDALGQNTPGIRSSGNNEGVPVVPAINVDWSIIAERIFSPDQQFWRALATTVSIAVIAQLLGVGLGLASALAGLSRFWPVRALAGAYVLVMRGTPLIVQIFFIFFGANLFFGLWAVVSASRGQSFFQTIGIGFDLTASSEFDAVDRVARDHPRVTARLAK